MSIGFCKDNFDLNTNAISMNKKKDYWVLDLFDGEAFKGKSMECIKYIQHPSNFVRKGDVIGALIDLETGCIEYYKNGINLGYCFQEGMIAFRKNKVKIYPFIQLYMCKVSVYQPNQLLTKQYNEQKQRQYQVQPETQGNWGASQNQRSFSQPRSYMNANQEMGMAEQQNQLAQSEHQQYFPDQQQQQQVPQLQNQNQMQQKPPGQQKINLKEQFKIQEQIDKLQKTIDYHQQQLAQANAKMETLKQQLMI